MCQVDFTITADPVEKSASDVIEDGAAGLIKTNCARTAGLGVAVSKQATASCLDRHNRS